MQAIQHRTIDSPIGPIDLVASAAALVEVRLPRPEPGAGSSAGRRKRARRAELRGEPVTPGTHEVLDLAQEELDRYFRGRARRFTVPVAPSGTPFQEAVWRTLLEIPFGEVRSYGWVASHLGRDGASRAVGAANGGNPIAIVVPCHRVIGADGSLTGYGGGIAAKRWLLEHEGAIERRLAAM